ncbi:hypothetical protein [Peribacillus asahii]|uniref:hypothetical protein n=1 Tax=Peribacillus asahii TaxID=228899 RepID=UPI003800B0A7
MNETRKKIILQEIKYWKQTNLLPEQYCDYLLTLYSRGEEQITPSPKESSRSLAIPLWIFTSLFFLTLFVNYFTEINKGLQITITAFFIIMFGSFIYRYIESAWLLQLALVGLALLVLIESVHIVDLVFPNSTGALYMVLLVQCVIWFLVGRRLKLVYFSISGVIGAFIIVYFLARLFF